MFLHRVFAKTSSSTFFDRLKNKINLANNNFYFFGKTCFCVFTENLTSKLTTLWNLQVKIKRFQRKC